jgi:exportin-1
MSSNYKKNYKIYIQKTNSQNTNLINVTLETLLRFLNWIPLGYIFETELIPQLVETFLPMPLFRNVTLKCLTEIGKSTFHLILF